jgi:hypothetical protein
MAKKGFVHSAALLAVAGGLVALAPLAHASPARAASTQYTFTADAYGSTGTVGADSLGAGSDKSAYVILSCTSTPETHTNTTSGVSMSEVTTTTGNVTDTVSSAHNSSTGKWSDSANSAVDSLNALGGLVKVSAITASASAAEAPSGATVSGSTTLAGVTVNGKTESSHPAANTKINLAGIGTVTLNAQKSVKTKSQALMQVDAVEIVLSAGNSLHDPVGATIVIGQVLATVGGPVTGLLSGYAYGTSMTGNPDVNSGPSFVQYMNCTGTGGKTVTTQGSGVSASPLTAGQITDSATGTETSTQLSANTTATVDNSGISGVLTLTAVHVSASASVVSGTLHKSGTVTISGLKVLGLTVSEPGNVPPNTSVPLVGGTLILNRQVATAHGLQVNGVYLHLPSVGTVIIGFASAGAS